MIAYGPSEDARVRKVQECLRRIVTIAGRTPIPLITIRNGIVHTAGRGCLIWRRKRGQTRIGAIMAGPKS